MLVEPRFEVGDPSEQSHQHRAHCGWGGGPVFLGDVWYGRYLIVHSVYHTENAEGVKVGRYPERLPYAYFSFSENRPTRRLAHSLETQAVGTAALELLLAGPQQPGLSTALPTPEEIQSYPGRQPDWGDRVRLLGLTIEDGVATANSSQEIRAYGGGSARVQIIRAQITQTLLQFPTVQEVQIAVEGEVETALQP
jgi:hypothetical protein